MPSSSDSTIQRLKLIKNMIQLGETSDLQEQAEQLLDTDGISESLQEIAARVSDQRYSDAVSKIEDYLHQEAAIQQYEDPRLAALRLEAEALEQRLAELESEKSEIEREIHSFNLRHEQELGPILEEIFRIQAEKKRQRAEEKPKDSEARAEYEEAKAEYEEYSRAVEEAQAEVRIELTEEEEDELKTLYRKASKQCHPDAVEENRKEEARELFLELDEAYERNDLDSVRRIAEQIEEGVAFGSRSEEIDEVERLEAEVERLRGRVDELEKEIKELRSSDPYQILSEVDDLDEYFEGRKERLRDELDRLREDESISA